MDVRIRPLDLATWPGTVTPAGRRKSAQFRSTWSQTLDLLQAELVHLNARDVVIEAGFRSGDLRLDGWPRADARTPEFPGIVISFEAKGIGPLRYATDVYSGGTYWRSGTEGRPGTTTTIPGWQCNVRAIALSLEALRAVDRHGVTKRGEQYVGFGALPPAALALPRGMTVEEAMKVLGLGRSSATKDEISSAFRRRARETDPNQGGNEADHFRVIQARDVLLAALR